MRNLRSFEALCGVLAAILGLLGIAYVLFGPLYSFASSSGQAGTARLLQVGIQPVTLVVFGILVLGLIGVASGAVLHSRTRALTWKTLLWLSTVVIVVLAILAMLSIGIFLLPAILFAVLACVFAFSARSTALNQRIAQGSY